ncbi:MAG: extradiol dioxygenase [Frankiales bacterium]|nr:extradiol dioxygenase [Frankiales bacterium]
MPLGHLGINVPDLTAARAYYDVVMPAVDYQPFFATEEQFSYQPVDGTSGAMVFFYRTAEPRVHSPTATGVQHLAFTLSTREAVQAVRDLVAGLGSVVVHEPQEFPQYHAGYYATFWQDPFGLVLEAVCHQA